jgi:hypothetical protein
MKWFSLICGYRRNIMLTVDLDRLKVISSGSEDEDRCKSLVFQDGHLAAIFGV